MPWYLMIALITAGWTPAVAAQVEPGRAAGATSAAQGSDSFARQEATLEFRVVDARDKAPLRDVSIVVVGDVVARPVTLTTQADGHLRVAIPKPATRFVGISARKEGFVPIQVAWRGHAIGAELPESYTLALERATPIGGSVRDTRGRPIAGALVYVWFEREQRGDEREQQFLADEYHLKTDADGRWRCTMMPDDLIVKDRLMFRLIHPDYVSEPLGYSRRLPIEALRGMTSVMHMEDGVPLTGRVVDSRGLPIVGARVFLQVPGVEINLASLTPEQADCLQTETDADGRYRFGHIKPGERQVIIEASGHVRQGVPVVVGARPEPAEIRLTSLEVARRDYATLLAAQWDGSDSRSPNDIPQEWVMKVVLFVGAVVAGASLLSWLWRAGRRRQRVSVGGTAGSQGDEG
jgi:protocatechuate 3,4-dioxygenase beta subunit